MAKNPRDAIGNELYPGDMVTIDLKDITWTIGKIVQISPGGLSIPGRGNVRTTGKVRIMIDMNIDFPYGGAIPRVIKVVDPKQQEAIGKIMKN